MHWQPICKVNTINSTLLHSCGQIVFKYIHSKASSGQREFPNTHYLACNKWPWAVDSSLSDLPSLSATRSWVNDGLIKYWFPHEYGTHVFNPSHLTFWKVTQLGRGGLIKQFLQKKRKVITGFKNIKSSWEGLREFDLSFLFLGRIMFVFFVSSWGLL